MCDQQDEPFRQFAVDYQEGPYVSCAAGETLASRSCVWGQNPLEKAQSGNANYG
jgi:hypothetical protein